MLHEFKRSGNGRDRTEKNRQGTDMGKFLIDCLGKSVSVKTVEIAAVFKALGFTNY